VVLGPQSSSTFVDTENPFNTTYGAGSVSGTIITDNIVIAGLSLNQHVFGVGTTESVDFLSNTIDFDGIMGLGQSVRSHISIYLIPSYLILVLVVDRFSTDDFDPYRIPRQG
jgi:hypothetical protein